MAGGQEADEDGREWDSATESTTTCVHDCVAFCVAAGFRFSCRFVGCSPRGKLRRQYNASEHSKQTQPHTTTPNAKRIKQYDAKQRQPGPSNTMQSAARISVEFLTQGGIVRRPSRRLWGRAPSLATVSGSIRRLQSGERNSFPAGGCERGAPPRLPPGVLSHVLSGIISPTAGCHFFAAVLPACDWLCHLEKYNTKQDIDVGRRASSKA